MSHNILLTGASGYLGGSLSADWASANLPAYGTLYALVRTDEQEAAVKKYSAVPLRIDLANPEAIEQALVEHSITIVLWLIDVVKSEAQVAMIKGLAQVKKATGSDVHFVHTTGAKVFSSHAGAPTDRPLLDTDPTLYDIQRAQKAPFPAFQQAVATNCDIIGAGVVEGVDCYVFAPCIVYGKGKGFGNLISIQTVAIVQAARRCRRVYDPNNGQTIWPVCHIDDNTALYLQIVRGILEGNPPPSGKNGYYLASPGSVAWEDLYAAMARSLAQKGVVDDEKVEWASDDQVKIMADALGCPPETVGVQLGGVCTYIARRGKEIGWQPKYGPEHILEYADEEVQHILNISK